MTRVSEYQHTRIKFLSLNDNTLIVFHFEQTTARGNNKT